MHVPGKSYADATRFNVLIDGELDDSADVEETNEVKLMSVLERENRELHEVSQSEWVALPKPIIVDSGAGETVMPVDWLPSHPAKESYGSQNNEYYTTADGSKVYNEGQKNLFVSTPDGKQERAMTFQVAQVHKALGSMSQMVRNRSRVVFDADANWLGRRLVDAAASDW